jgi:surface protein
MSTSLQLVFSIVSGDTVTLNLSGGTITSINWGDGTTNTTLSHTYASTGSYTVDVSGNGVTNFNGTNAQGSITACNSFGEIGLTNLDNAFVDASITIVPSSLPTTSQITSMVNMFYSAGSFNQNISGWDVSHVTNMDHMFYGTYFNQPIGNWDVSSVTNMFCMFQRARSFNQNIGNWDISNVTEMYQMLYESGLSITNYNALLIGWAAQTVQPNVRLGASGLTYSTPALAAHNTLTSAPNNWTILDDTYYQPPLQLVFSISNGNSGDTITLNLIGGTITSINWGDGTTNTDLSHTYASDGSYNVAVLGNDVTEFHGLDQGIQYLTGCTSFGEIGLTDLRSAFTGPVFTGASNLTTAPTSLPTTSQVTNMNYMFYGTTSFNQDISGWDVSHVTTMDGMFAYSGFNQPIGGWNVSNVTNPGYMFYNATSFNQDISGWTTTNATRMVWMFKNASSFNQNIGSWNVSTVTQMDNMLDGTALSITNYNALLIGWAAQNVQSGVTLGADGLTYTQPARAAHNTLTSAPKNWTINGDTYLPPPICFKEDTKILTTKGYLPIQELRQGDLIKTINHGYVPICMIGKKELYHPASKERIKEQLYKCSKDQYPEIFEPLIITGCHSILLDEFDNEEQRQETIRINGDTYITDNYWRVPACADQKATVYETPGTYTIYHLALENDDYYMNYGIYANGLLVETCSKRYLKELSNMELL